MAKIKMTAPLVELDGDEMTRVIWQSIKDELLAPYIDLNLEYYDLGLPERDRTSDQVTFDAADAIKKHGVGVKCATITPTTQQVSEYKLKKMWPSPNATIRGRLDGTVFRAPITVASVNPVVRTWKKPITIARHAYGDIYKASEMKIDGPGKAELVFTAADGTVTKKPIHDFKGPGVLLGQHNLDSSISSFARACFTYALGIGQNLWFSTKDTISGVYDYRFRDIFQKIFDSEFKDKFNNAGLEYWYLLIDAAAERIIRSEGGFVWACKNYDGDVMSDLVSAAFGSIAMMTSILVTPDGKYEYEAAHGTVTRHYQRHLKGEDTSTNSMATLFAWTGALAKRGELDSLPGLTAFAKRLEAAALNTIDRGLVTGEIARLSSAPDLKVLNTFEFIKAIRTVLEE